MKCKCNNLVNDEGFYNRRFKWVLPTLTPESTQEGISLQVHTLQPLYNMVRYNTVLDITRFKDGSQKCIDYIEK